MQYQTKFQSPLGELQLISDGSALTHLLYPSQHIENVKTKGLTTISKSDSVARTIF